VFDRKREVLDRLDAVVEAALSELPIERGRGQGFAPLALAFGAELLDAGGFLPKRNLAAQLVFGEVRADDLGVAGPAPGLEGALFAPAAGGTFTLRGAVERRWLRRFPRVPRGPTPDVRPKPNLARATINTRRPLTPRQNR
jgi:hypothetical protein